MRDRSHPWKWPLSVALALLLTGSIFLWLPEGWLTIGRDREAGRGRYAREAPPAWLVLAPPPEIQIEEVAELRDKEDPAIPEPPPSDPRWWTRGWRVVTEEAVGRDLRPAPAAVDSVAIFLEHLGVGSDLLSQVRPDSVLAARLILLQRENQMRFDELKPYYQAVTRCEAYSDILSRAADMYGDFLQQEIMVPD